jgi:hypothetical protein
MRKDFASSIVKNFGRVALIYEREAAFFKKKDFDIAS